MGTLPTSDNIKSALCAAGITATLSVCSSARSVAITAFETETGWVPFVASDTAAEYPVHVPGASTYATIDMGGGILPTGTPVVKIDGDTLEAGTDYQLAPVDAARRRVPYNYIKFLNRRIGLSSGPLLVTGRWGYCDDGAVPEDAYDAILAYACLRIASSVVQAQTTNAAADARPIARQNELGITTDFATSVTERTAALTRWEETWKAGLKSYRRLVIQ